jgi:hypothetical protein
MYLPWKRTSVANRRDNLREFGGASAIDRIFQKELTRKFREAKRQFKLPGAATQSFAAMLK